MVNIAVLGYGTVGSGVVEVINTNQEIINKRAGQEINVKYVLDLRDFPGDPVEKILVHDYDVIVTDPTVDIIVEVMGGVDPAYKFVKRALLMGKSVCTSMGFSPVDGLVMGTRCGDVDPSALLFIAEKEGMNLADINTMINKRSGVEGLSGVSSDMRDIDAAYDAGNPRAIIARDIYYGRVKQYIGKYAALMGGVDLVIFTGGVGENSWELRDSATSGLEYMGISLNHDINKVTRGTDTIISSDNSHVKVAVIATNEELVIATDTYNLTK